MRGDSLEVEQSAAATFQSTPLREGRLLQDLFTLLISRFQSTPLREGRREGLQERIAELTFQSTPLREGRRRARISK